MILFLTNIFLSGSKNALYTSNYIQNDMISSINHVIKRQLKDIIFNKKVLLIADKTSDIGHHEKLSIVIRYFNKHTNYPEEQFFCIKQITSINAQSIYNSLINPIQEYNIKWRNTVSVCFDGASTMSECTIGVQAKFKEKNFFCSLLWTLLESCSSRFCWETTSNGV